MEESWIESTKSTISRTSILSLPKMLEKEEEKLGQKAFCLLYRIRFQTTC